jgi:hypothetical protein
VKSLKGAELKYAAAETSNLAEARDWQMTGVGVGGVAVVIHLNPQVNDNKRKGAVRPVTCREVTGRSSRVALLFV